MHKHGNEECFIQPQSILRLPAVSNETSLSKSTIYSNISNGLWTRPVKIGARAVGWPRYEVHQLIAARIAGSSDEEIKVLVTQLEAARKALRT